MTPEQKKKVPRHLRGAGVVRFWCPFCDTYHRTPTSFCRNNPDYEKNRENHRRAVSAAAKKQYHEDGGGERLREAQRRKWQDPAERRKAAAVMSKRASKISRKGRKNPNYGKKHSLQTRLKMSRSQTRVQNRLTEKDTARVVSPVFRSDAADFFNRELPPRHERDEFSGGTGGGSFQDDEFDPFA